MNEPLILILNPHSGTSDENFRATIETELTKHDAAFEIRETTSERGADVLAQEAVREGSHHLVACGGDGTIMSAVNGLGRMEHSTEDEGAAPQVTFSIIPGGTANLLATALGIPHDVEEAVEIALEGQDREIDLGFCGNQLFALGVGIGLTERLVSQTSTQEKEKLGRWAYVKAMLSELGASPHQFSFQLDDGSPQTSSGVAVVIANSGDIGGKLKFAPDAEMDDGQLDLCILHRFYLRDVLRMAGRSFFGDVTQDRAVSFFQARTIEIRSQPPLDLQIDGEEVEMQTPLIAEVRPRALKVRVPLKQAESLLALPVEAAQAITDKRRWPFAVVTLLAAPLVGLGLWLWHKRRR